MVARTSTEHAPWTLVEGDDKPYARVKVLQTVCDGMREGGLNLDCLRAPNVCR
jgi:polyphosphate kinase 2 (PPK2 family)